MRVEWGLNKNCGVISYFNQEHVGIINDNYDCL